MLGANSQILEWKIDEKYRPNAYWQKPHHCFCQLSVRGLSKLEDRIPFSTCYVVLTIFLRQKGAPESKPVDAPYLETGK